MIIQIVLVQILPSYFLMLWGSFKWIDWIDSSFKDEFAKSPQKTLEFNGVYLPEDMSIEFQKPNSDRPRIVVYEQRPNSRFKLRVLYLPLVMMAGRWIF